MIKLIVALALVAMAAAEMRNYTGYKVIRVTPHSHVAAILLHKFTEISNTEHIFWNNVMACNVSTDLMISPQETGDLLSLINLLDVPHSLIVEDVQDLIDAENPPQSLPGEIFAFNWRRYHTLDEINNFLFTASTDRPNVIEVIAGGTTYEGRWIKGLKLSFKSNNPAIFIEGGMHGREWISPAVATYLINELLTSEDPDIRELAENNDWYIFPVVNPDGYVYTHTHDRLWVKTRKPYGSCYGSDPDRNWGYMWRQDRFTNDSCQDDYSGTRSFSEIETKSLSEFITSISNELYAYISFRSYSQVLSFPYGYTELHLDNYDELYAIGTKAIQALSRRYGTTYITGNAVETSYFGTGGSVDWVKGTFQTPLAYTYKLRDNQDYGFLLPADQIIPTGQEVLDSLVALFKEARARGIPAR